MPMTEKTLKYLGNHSYVFTAYIKEDKIVRQFIKTQISSYSALQSTVIPITDATFHKFYYWQTDMFRGKTFKRSNHCLIRLMQHLVNDRTMEVCQAAPNTEGLEKVR